MKCPECGNEVSDSAKFCKKCGASLSAKGNIHQNLTLTEKSNSNDKTTKIIIVALIIIVIALAGAFGYYLYASNANNNNVPTNNQSEQVVSSSNAQPATSSSSNAVSQSSSPMIIRGGSFSTGSALSDKTYCSVYVGTEHVGESCKIRVQYSRDGSSLNTGNIVPKTVDSSGYINVRSADAYKYYPDYAIITLYDSNGNIMDQMSVTLSPTSGTQTF